MDWIDYLKQANDHPVGIALLCNTPKDADAAKRQLYVARAEANKNNDKSFNGLGIAMSPHAGDVLYIWHKKETEETSGELEDAL